MLHSHSSVCQVLVSLFHNSTFLIVFLILLCNLSLEATSSDCNRWTLMLSSEPNLGTCGVMACGSLILPFQLTRQLELWSISWKNQKKSEGTDVGPELGYTVLPNPFLQPWELVLASFPCKYKYLLLAADPSFFWVDVSTKNSRTQKTLSFCLSQPPQGKTCWRICYLQKQGKNISINSPDERVACICFCGDSVWQLLSLLKSPCCLWKGVHQSSTCFHSCQQPSNLRACLKAPICELPLHIHISTTFFSTVEPGNQDWGTLNLKSWMLKAVLSNTGTSLWMLNL